MDKRYLLNQKLEEVARLEREFDVLGVSFAVREGARISTEDSVDYVRMVIDRSVRLIEQRGDLHDPGFSPPR